MSSVTSSGANAETTQPAGAGEEIVRVENLHKTYRLGRVDVPVLRGVSLRVKAGEFVAILGASGSGKSTLLHLLGGLDRPDLKPAPVMKLLGRDVAKMSGGTLNEYRGSDVGFVFQFYHLLPELSVLENVLVAAMVRLGRLGYARHSRTLRTEAADLLTTLGLGHRLEHRPAELSGGERQRVAIGRALINRPRLLLADEPTGNLDRATGTKILDALLEIGRQRSQTMLVVTHDEQTAARADRVVRILDGRIVG